MALLIKGMGMPDHCENCPAFEEVFNEKVNAIIAKNNKKVAPWCEVGNVCGRVCRNLYLKAHEMNDKYFVPQENTLTADAHAFNKKVAKDFGFNANSAQTFEKLGAFDMYIGNEYKSTNKTNFVSSKEQEKLEENTFEKRK